MSVTSGGSVTKATFESEDGTSFSVQYNPKDFKFSKSAQWQEHTEQGKVGSLEFQSTGVASMECELIFDTTKDGSDVRQKWVNPLLNFMYPTQDAKSGEQSNLPKKRPPKVTFTWGEFTLTGIIESANVTYLMFSASGTPLRAQVSVKMKEWKTNKYPTSGQSPVKLVDIQAGQTVTAIALQYNTTTRAIMNDNPHLGTDATADHSGKTVAVTPGKLV